MLPRSKLRFLRLAGKVCVVLLMSIGAGTSAASVDIDHLLKDADQVKSANQAQFNRDLAEAEAQAVMMTPDQRMLLRYLRAWQTGYFGDYRKAIPELEAIISQSTDVNLRFRAGVTVVNALEIATRNEEAFSRLSQLLDLLPHVTDPEARQQGMIVAGLVYNQAGQYDLATSYANRLIAENSGNKGICKGYQIKLEALYQSGKAGSAGDDPFLDGIEACKKLGEPIWTNFIRTYLASVEIAKGKYDIAIQLLESNYDEIQRTHYPRLISAVDSTLAQAYWKTGNEQDANRYAHRAIDGAVKNELTEPLVGAYRVLYETADKDGDYKNALGYHEMYAAADKGYLNEISARALAYQMVSQQVLEKKAQVEALSQQNQVLQLKQAVNSKNMIAIELGVALLLVVLGSIVTYAYRTKRSQLKFQKLARRDGLTEIFNRQYFVEVCEQELEYCRKSVRDVSVVAIDLDHFKQINDTHGHAAGDFALKRAVVACQKHLRSVDVFGRLGGEEFGILMPDCVPERAFDMAEKMRQSIAAMIGAEGEPEFEVTASFGVTAARWSGYSLMQLLAQADSALYQAKREGRNRVIAIAGPPAANSEPAPGVGDRRKA
jgi:diguanylate cyclase (GGDEF)-like protein